MRQYLTVRLLSRDTLVTVCSVLTCCLPLAAWGDAIDLRHTYTGPIDYLFTGQALTDNTGEVDGVNCLQPNGVLVIDANMLTPGATLLSAQLYVAGSLIDDGLDYPPSEEIFTTPANSRADVAEDVPMLNALARQWASISVDLTPPGATAPVKVSTDATASYVSVYYISSGQEAGNVGFFTTPIDITDVINSSGGGVMAGTYRVGNVLADVCRGQEAVCGVTTCSQLSNLHTNGTASFALLLVYQDPSLALRTVSIFEGLQNLFANTQSIALVNGGVVSLPASGSLSYFVVEGDLSISGAQSGATCGGAEYVTVHSVPPSPAGVVCLNDADNPPGNIFNGTINTLPAGPNPPAGCTGPHLCGLAGVDIDRFDISTALQPTAGEIDVEISTGSDRIGAAVFALGVDVYAPLLQVDSQFRTLGKSAPKFTRAAR